MGDKIKISMSYKSTGYYSNILKFCEYDPEMYYNKSLGADFSILALQFHSISSKDSPLEISFFDLGCHTMVTFLRVD